MKRIMRVLLTVGLLVGSLAYCVPDTEAGPFRRGGRGGFGWGRTHYGPGWGYRQAYRPYGSSRGLAGSGPGFGGFGMGYPGYSGVYGGYRYSGFGLGDAGYYGNSAIIGGSPLTGYYAPAFPF
jgi:hypothetical protein